MTVCELECGSYEHSDMDKIAVGSIGSVHKPVAAVAAAAMAAVPGAAAAADSTDSVVRKVGSCWQAGQAVVVVEACYIPTVTEDKGMMKMFHRGQG